MKSSGSKDGGKEKVMLTADEKKKRPFNGTCWGYGKKGHRESECKSKKRDGDSDDKSMNGRAAPEKYKAKKSSTKAGRVKLLMAKMGRADPGAPDYDCFILDSGASRHMVCTQLRKVPREFSKMLKGVRPTKYIRPIMKFFLEISAVIYLWNSRLPRETTTKW